MRAHRDMRTRPTGEMVRDDPGGEPSVPGRTDRADDARRIALAVRRAAAFGLFRPKCLVRSMALRRLLNEAGIEGATVRVGVMLVKGKFLAHAWVEYGGEVVGDDPDVASRFVPLSGIQVAELE